MQLDKFSADKLVKKNFRKKRLKLKELNSGYFLRIIIIAVIILIFLGAFFYFLNRAGYINFPPTDQKILAQLKKIILLPDSVVPSMAIVMNAQTLKQQQQAFFANVKNGDRLIIYPDLVIIYDYNANKIIKVGPVQAAKTQ